MTDHKIETRHDSSALIEIGKDDEWHSHSLMEKIGTHEITTGEVIEVFQSMSRGTFYFYTPDHVILRWDATPLLDAMAEHLGRDAKVYRARRGLPDPLSQPPASRTDGLVVGAAGHVKPPPEPAKAPKPYKCSVCKRFGADVHVNCQYPGCPDGR